MIVLKFAAAENETFLLDARGIKSRGWSKVFSGLRRCYDSGGSLCLECFDNVKKSWKIVELLFSCILLTGCSQVTGLAPLTLETCDRRYFETAYGSITA